MTFKIKVGRITAHKKCADVAQLVEHLICNQAVGGSSPLISSMFFVKQCLTRNVQVDSQGELLKRPKRADCKSAGFTFEGSNPSLTTTQ